MANRHRCEVPIQLDIPRSLCLDFNACADYQKETGSCIDAFFFRIQQIHKKYNIRPEVLDADGKVLEPLNLPPEAAVELMNALGQDQLRVILWAGLRGEDSDMTIRRAGELVGEAQGDSPIEQFAYIVSKASDAYNMRQIGGKGDKKKGNP